MQEVYIHSIVPEAEGYNVVFSHIEDFEQRIVKHIPKVEGKLSQCWYGWALLENGKFQQMDNKLFSDSLRELLNLSENRVSCYVFRREKEVDVLVISDDPELVIVEEKDLRDFLIKVKADVVYSWDFEVPKGLYERIDVLDYCELYGRKTRKIGSVEDLRELATGSLEELRQNANYSGVSFEELLTLPEKPTWNQKSFVYKDLYKFSTRLLISQQLYDEKRMEEFKTSKHIAQKDSRKMVGELTLPREKILFEYDSYIYSYEKELNQFLEPVDHVLYAVSFPFAQKELRETSKNSSESQVLVIASDSGIVSSSPLTRDMKRAVAKLLV